MRRCGSMSTPRASSRIVSRHTRSSSSRTYMAGCERASDSAWPPNRLRYSVSRRVGSWPSPWGFATQMSTARSFAPRLAAVTSRLPLCRARFPCLPRRGHPGTVLPRQRHPVGDRASGCRRRSCADRARRIARRYVLARRAAADGRVGVRTMKRRDASAGIAPLESRPSSGRHTRTLACCGVQRLDELCLSCGAVEAHRSASFPASLPGSRVGGGSRALDTRSNVLIEVGPSGARGE